MIKSIILSAINTFSGRQYELVDKTTYEYLNSWEGKALSIHRYYMKDIRELQNKKLHEYMNNHPDEFPGLWKLVTIGEQDDREYLSRRSTIMRYISSYTEYENERIAIYLRYRFMKKEKNEELDSLCDEVKEFPERSNKIIDFILENSQDRI